MAQFIMHYHTYEINTLADLAMVRAQLEELHRQKKVSDSEYEHISKRLDQFPHHHTLKK